MSFDSTLNHRVTIMRDVPTGDLDSLRHQVVNAVPIATDVPASIQPKSVRELAIQSDAGVTVSDFTVYLRPRSLTEQDRVDHDASTCPADPDLPDATYLVRGVRDSAGRGHHLEVDVAAVAKRSTGGS